MSAPSRDRERHPSGLNEPPAWTTPQPSPFTRCSCRDRFGCSKTARLTAGLALSLHGTWHSTSTRAVSSEFTSTPCIAADLLPQAPPESTE